MLRNRIDRTRVRADIALAASEASAIKRALRTTWQRPMADEQRRLCRLKRRLTELYVLLASIRGRFHLSTPPEELRAAGRVWDRAVWHAKIAERMAVDYAVPERPEVSA